MEDDPVGNSYHVPFIAWMVMSVEAQGCAVKKILFRDIQITIWMEVYDGNLFTGPARKASWKYRGIIGMLGYF